MIEKRYTYDEILAELRKAVEAKGTEFIYEPFDVPPVCRNFDDNGRPSCIAGHVYDQLGLAPSEPEARTASGGMWLSMTVLSLSDEELIHLTDKARSLLFHAQSEQDAGFAWGEAVERAVENTAKGDYNEQEEYAG